MPMRASKNDWHEDCLVLLRKIWNEPAYTPATLERMSSRDLEGLVLRLQDLHNWSQQWKKQLDGEREKIRASEALLAEQGYKRDVRGHWVKDSKRIAVISVLDGLDNASKRIFYTAIEGGIDVTEIGKETD